MAGGSTEPPSDPFPNDSGGHFRRGICQAFKAGDENPLQGLDPLGGLGRDRVTGLFMA
jgi:hypothetical protein